MKFYQHLQPGRFYSVMIISGDFSGLIIILPLQVLALCAFTSKY